MKLYSLGASPSILADCPAHSHQVWEFSINTLGSGTAWIEEQAYPFSEGTILCIPPKTFHRKQAEKGFKDLYFHTDVFPSFDNREMPTDKPIVMQDDSEKCFEMLVRLILSLYYQKKPEERGVVLSLFRVAMQLLSVRSSSKKGSPLVEQVKNKIIADFSNPELDLVQLLGAGHYSENYMRKKFKEQVGMTPTEYLTHLRIDYAKQLLSQKKLLNVSIATIAEMCGYYDEHYFSRVFRAKTGMSPREYLLQRDILRNEEDLEGFV